MLPICIVSVLTVGPSCTLCLLCKVLFTSFTNSCTFLHYIQVFFTHLCTLCADICTLMHCQLRLLEALDSAVPWWELNTSPHYSSQCAHLSTPLHTIAHSVLTALNTSPHPRLQHYNTQHLSTLRMVHSVSRLHYNTWQCTKQTPRTLPTHQSAT